MSVTRQKARGRGVGKARAPCSSLALACSGRKHEDPECHPQTRGGHQPHGSTRVPRDGHACFPVPPFPCLNPMVSVLFESSRPIPPKRSCSSCTLPAAGATQSDDGGGSGV